MVNEEKIRRMTQISLDETKTKKRDIAEGNYEKSDYVRSHTVSVIWSVTISYLFLGCLVALYYADYLFLHVAQLHYERIGFILFGIYLIIIVLSVLLSYLYYSKKYLEHKRALDEYLDHLDALSGFYRKNEEEAENDTAAAH